MRVFRGGTRCVLDRIFVFLFNGTMNSAHPFLEEGMRIAWSQLTPERARVDVREGIARARRALDELGRLDPAEMTYENTFAALEKAPEDLHRAWGRLMHLDMVMDKPARREAVAELMPEVVGFSSSIALDAKVWNAVRRASECDWVRELSPTKKRFIEETLADFRESGADLSEAEKKRFAEVQTELSLATKRFAENVLDSTNAWELVVEDKKELDGLPESAREAARQSALAKGIGTEEDPRWLFTLQFTSMMPVMQYAESDALRRRMWEGANTIGNGGEYDNAQLIANILELRDEKARLLGFTCYGDYATSRRMAGSGENALAFVDGLHDKIRAAFVEEQEDLRLYKEEKTGRPCPMLAPWETSFWAEKRRRELYDFDGEALRPYFGVENVMDGLFAIYSQLYGLRITERPTAWRDEGSEEPLPEGAVEVWHPEVRFYELHDAASGEHLGSFYADWHPRDSKRAGAWMDVLQIGLPPVEGRARIPHLGLMCGNMTKPVAGKPALLDHREVETIFHEFGHLLHQLLSEVEVRSLSGTNVAWDFVELPSQINENWCWERESVDLFARHFETGEPIPDELFARMRAARNDMSATAFMRQLSFAKPDLELHVHLDRYKGRDLEEVEREILADYRVPMTEQGPAVLRRMTHLFADAGGYAAGYYSYKWAEVLEADAFSRFLAEGILNPATGADFRRCILSRGNSRPAAELYRDFMGRDPDPDALLKKTGILKPQSPAS